MRKSDRQRRAQKSVLSRLAALSPAQRRDYQVLVDGGMDPATARAIVQSGATVQKAARPSYHQAYAARARATLPAWQHDALHQHARAVAGGHASALSRQAPAPEVARAQEVQALKDRLRQIEGPVDKGTLTSSDVHVDVPIDASKKKPAPQRLDELIIKAAYDVVIKASFNEQDHPRDKVGMFSEGGGASGASSGQAGADVPFANPKDVKEIKPKKPRQKPVPYADPKDVIEIKPGKKPSRNKAPRVANPEDAARAGAQQGRQSLAGKKEVIGSTQSGKPIHAGVKAEHKANSDFTAQDHADAAGAHHAAAQTPLHARAAGGTTPVTQEQSREAQQSHGRAAVRMDRQDKNQRSDARAEVSRIGQTSSGKSIYADDAASHRRYRGYSKKDHLDAAQAHANKVKEAQDKGDAYRASRHLSMAKGHLKQASAPVKKAALSQAQALAYAQAAYELIAPIAPLNPDADKVPDGAEQLMQANRLIAGMDAEMAAGASEPEDARRRASRNLQDRPGLYDAVGATSMTDRLDGVMLDIGCGDKRAAGFIGLDVDTCGDYGVALHDCNLGLREFPDGSVRAVRLIDALDAILSGEPSRTDGGADASLLIDEIQRVLCEGGILTYAGKLPLFTGTDRWPWPGLFLMGESSVPAGAGGATLVQQSFERVALRVPAYHGADADYAAAGPQPVAQAMQVARQNAAPARMAMANLVHKTANKICRIAKTKPMQQVLIGVVLEPDTPDLQGDTISRDDIEAAAHGYLGTSRVIGSEHGAPIEAHPVESYIAPQDLTFDGPDGATHVSAGSWVLGVKVASPKAWQAVMDGQYTGFSVGGFGLREEM